MGIGKINSLLYRNGTSYRLIDTHKSGDEVVRRERVSDEWWEHIQQARHYRNVISRNYISNKGVKSVGISQGCNKIGNKRRVNIIIGVESESSGRDIPAEVNGVKIIKKNVPDRRLMVECENAGDYPNMPGGVEINEPNKAGTSTCAVKDTEEDQVRMLSANHLFTGGYGDCEDTTSTKVLQNRTYLGYVTKNDQDLDFGFVDLSLNGSYTYENEVLDSSLGSRVNIAGYVSYNGVCVMICNDACTSNNCEKDNVRKEGIALGSLTDGYISQIDYERSTCPTYDGDGIVTTFDIAGGDSGGPMYDYYNGDAYILAINSGSTQSLQYQTSCRNDEGNTVMVYAYGGASGPSAYSIYDNYRMRFSY